MKWGEAYPKYLFKYPWDISKFVCKGGRLDKPSEMRDDVFKLICNCWKENPKERYTIDEIILALGELAKNSQKETTH